jgi:hypothetical protein
VQNFNSPNYVRFIIFVKPKKVFRFEILYVGIVRHYLHLGFSCRIMWKYEFYIFQKKGLHIACVLKRILKKKSPMTALCCSSGCFKRISSMKKLGDDILYRPEGRTQFFFLISKACFESISMLLENSTTQIRWATYAPKTYRLGQ